MSPLAKCSYKNEKEFKGHLTLVVFPFLRMSKKSPEQTAQEIGEYLLRNEPAVAEFNVIKGFLNLTVACSCWIDLLNSINEQPAYGIIPVTEQSPLVMIEYSSPNTNKPLHLGHVRNNLLGYSLSKIMKANGNQIVKTNIVTIVVSISVNPCWLGRNGEMELPQSLPEKGRPSDR